MTGGHFISLFFAVVEPISILMLIFMSTRDDSRQPHGILVRIGYILMCWGLATHAFAQFELLADYREPRTWSWLPFQFGVNWTIWALYWQNTKKRIARKAKA